MFEKWKNQTKMIKMLLNSHVQIEYKQQMSLYCENYTTDKTRQVVLFG